MVVAAAKIILDFWGNEDLRHKKQLIASLQNKLQDAFAIPLTEIQDFEDLEKCCLGFAFCSSDLNAAKTKMRKILEFIDKNSAARMISEDSDFQIFP